ncbi:MAG TPA: hypothetical protein VGQ52_21855 [Gemmatimonadaceae bacterium]|nr:hypothetical protein [Gemmatimonadaceae bacterium]
MITSSSTTGYSVSQSFTFSIGVGLVFALGVWSCDDVPTETPPISKTTPVADIAASLSDGVTAASTIVLPMSTTGSTSGVAFHVIQTGSGINGRFAIQNSANSNIALEGVTDGSGHAFLGWNIGRGHAGVFLTSSSTNTKAALDVSSSGDAFAVDVRQNHTSTTKPALQVATLGRSSALLVNHKGASGNLAVFQTAGTDVARINRSGRAFFNGGVQHNGADVAEAFAVEGSPRDYEPGDVLVISATRDRRVEKSDGAYSTLVAGVYATKPGVLLTDTGIDEDLADRVPLGIVGVIPTKVSAENGAIHRGDLLVTARLPGHAMRGSDRSRMLGAVIGKALEEFHGSGSGRILALVNVK